jgi:hypothetical protein
MKRPISEITYGEKERWRLVKGDTIVEGRLTGDTHHSTYRTHYKGSEDLERRLGKLSSEELINIAILELKHIAWMSDHGTLSPATILSIWIDLNGALFLKAFSPLCEKKDWTVEELQSELERTLLEQQERERVA